MYFFTMIKKDKIRFFVLIFSYFFLNLIKAALVERQRMESSGAGNPIIIQAI